MRNDHKSWKTGVRVAKQFGGALAGRLGAAARPIARTLGYKKGDRVYKKGGSAKQWERSLLKSLRKLNLNQV